MAYTVREVTDMAAFEHLVAFQEHSADEVSHRRERAGFSADARPPHAQEGNRPRPRRTPPLLS